MAGEWRIVGGMGARLLRSASWRIRTACFVRSCGQCSRACSLILACRRRRKPGGVLQGTAGDCARPGGLTVTWTTPGRPEPGGAAGFWCSAGAPCTSATATSSAALHPSACCAPTPRMSLVFGHTHRSLIAAGRRTPGRQSRRRRPAPFQPDAERRPAAHSRRRRRGAADHALARLQAWGFRLRGLRNPDPGARAPPTADRARRTAPLSSGLSQSPDRRPTGRRVPGPWRPSAEGRPSSGRGGAPSG